MTLARAFYRITKGKDSPFDIFLNENGVIVSSQGVSRCDLSFRKAGDAPVVLSSSVEPSWFVLEQLAVYEGVSTTAVRVNLKDAVIDPGVYETDVFVYDAQSTDGRYAGTIDVQVDAPLSHPLGALPVADLFGNLRFPTLTPAQLTADVNDYNPGPEAFWRLSSDATRKITGIAFIANSYFRQIVNFGVNNIVLTHQNVASLAVNRIITEREKDLVLKPGGFVFLIYDGDSARWRVAGRREAPYYQIAPEEQTAGLSETDLDTAYAVGNWKRLLAIGDGVVDDAAAIQNSLNIWQQDVVGANIAQFVPKGSYKTGTPLTVKDSASQWRLTGEARARSNELVATAALAGQPLLKLKNLREATIERLGFKGDAAAKPSHLLLFDRETATQTGVGNPGHNHTKNCLFRNAVNGIEIRTQGVSGNDQYVSEDDIIGAGISELGYYIPCTNAAWNNLRGTSFDSCGFADISNIVALGAARGGAFTAQQTKHILSKLVALVGDCRYASFRDTTCEQTENLLWTSGKFLRANDISVNSDTFNSVAGAFPLLTAGRVFYVKGMTNAANNSIFMASGIPTAFAIPCTKLNGDPAGTVNETAGASVLMAPTRLTLATDTSTISLDVAEVQTTAAYPLVVDADDAQVITYVRGEVSLANGGIACCFGSATLVFGPGRYQLSGIIVEGTVILQAGAVFTAGTVAITRIGSGKVINLGAIGGGFDVAAIFFADGATNPAVDGGVIFSTNNTAPTIIVGLVGGYNGQQIRIRFNDALTTIQHGTLAGEIVLRAGVNATPSVGDVLELYKNANGIWVELSTLGLVTRPDWTTGAHATLRDFTGTTTAAQALQLVETLVEDLTIRGLLK